jgi:glycerophosphoryl diester phosphodiesterase
VSERRFSQEPATAVVAHRGDPGGGGENSLPAFARAIEAGADAVEFDVRVTRDGVAVVMHDPDVARTTGGAGLVRELELAELKALRIQGGPEGPAEVPTLLEVLRLCSGRAGVDIEIKNIPGEPDFDPDGERAVEATVRDLHDARYSGPAIVTSFNPFSIARARQLAPEVPTGLLASYDVDARAAATYASEQGHPWVLPFVDRVREAGEGFPAEVHGAGLRLGTWVEDDPRGAVELARWGVDAIATNDPATIVRALAAAGLR